MWSTEARTTSSDAHGFFAGGEGKVILAPVKSCLVSGSEGLISKYLSEAYTGPGTVLGTIYVLFLLVPPSPFELGHHFWLLPMRNSSSERFSSLP